MLGCDSAVNDSLYNNTEVKTMGKGLSSKRTAMAAQRFKKYQNSIKANNNLTLEVCGFASNINKNVIIHKSIQEPIMVKEKESLNSEQIDGLINIKALPQLKPNNMNYEVLVM